MDWKSSLESLRSSLPEGDGHSADSSADAAKAPVTAAASHASPAKCPEKARLDVLLDRKGRKGKDATIIAGFTIPDDEISRLASTLRQRLGTGGSSRGGEILIQGDKRRQALDLLTSLGFKARII